MANQKLMALTLGALGLGACGGKDSAGLTFKMQLAAPVGSVAANAVPSTLAVGDQLSFTPTGFRLPIMKITLSEADGNNAQTLYSCSSTTEADCLVDLASQTALDTIAAAAGSSTIQAGTYSLIQLYTCADGKGGSDQTTAYLKGSASFQGSTWVTDTAAASGIDKTGSATATETAITNWGCVTKSLVINPTITVSSDTSSQLTVLVDNTFGASFAITTSGGRGGCKTATSSPGDGVCAEYPALLPVLGTETATTSRFLIAHHNSDPTAIQDAKANALVIVAKAGTTPLMAYGRILYTATSAEISHNTGPSDATFGGPNYITETNYATFALNADGSIAFEQGGSADTYAADFSAFKLEDHKGEVKTKDGLVTWQYHAIPLL